MSTPENVCPALGSGPKQSLLEKQAVNKEVKTGSGNFPDPVFLRRFIVTGLIRPWIPWSSRSAPFQVAVAKLRVDSKKNCNQAGQITGGVE
jgi:hypothetical protein